LGHYAERRVFQKLRIDKLNITEDDIGFLVAPCVNVASRMAHATISFSLLTTASPEEAESFSQKLIGINNERKKITEELFKKVDSDLSQLSALPEVIVLGDESWPIGILPLLLNKILDKYNRPVIGWGRGDASYKIKGSCRSNGRINLVELLTEIGDKIFIEYGGHKMSGGFSVDFEKIHTLEEVLVKSFVSLK